MTGQRTRCLPPISTRGLTYDPAGRRFAVDASDLPAGSVGQIYHDAADLGLVLASHRTGREMPMVLSRTERCDGEVIYHDFTPALERDRATGVVVRVFND